MAATRTPAHWALVWGMGRGEQLRRALKAHNRVVLFALDVPPAGAEAARASLAELCPSGLGRDPQVEFVCVPPTGVGAVLEELGTRHVGSPRVYVDREALQNVPPEMEAVASAVLRTRREHARPQARQIQMRDNLRQNLSSLAAAHDVSRLAGLARGRPVFVVAAGPSLDRALQSGAVDPQVGPVVVVDTALGPVMSHGVTPDIVCTVDPRPESVGHLQTLSADQLNALESLLAFQPYAHPGVVSAFPRPHYLALPAGDRLSATAAGPLQHTCWPTGGTVLLFALQLADSLGGDPLVLVGTDFAHVDNRTHAQKTAYGRPAPQSTVADLDYGGQAVATTPVLRDFRMATELYLRGLHNHGPQRRFYALDGGGAAIAGAEPIALPSTGQRAAALPWSDVVANWQRLAPVAPRDARVVEVRQAQWRALVQAAEAKTAA